MSDERVRPAPAERFDASVLRFDLAAEIDALGAEPTPTRQGHRQKTLYKHGGGTVALFVMEAGASLREHSADGTVTIQPIRGELSIAADGREHRLGPGRLLVLPPGVPHDVKAADQAAFLLHVSLEPTG